MDRNKLHALKNNPQLVNMFYNVVYILFVC